MGKRIDLTGQRFGRWAISGYSHTTKKGNVYWDCRCMCGTSRKVVGFNLTGGKSKSCGCLKKEVASKLNRKPPGTSALNGLYLNYKAGAKRRKYSFSLSKIQFKKLTQQKCCYCGQPPSNCFSRNECHGSYTYNGIDRVDNARGYEVDNVVPCCEACNRMKLAASQEEFLERVTKIYEHSIKEK